MIKKSVYGIFIIALSYVFLNLFVVGAYWNSASAQAGSIPYQIGLTGVQIIDCYTTGEPPVCTGGTLCHVRDAARCLQYSDVSGTPAGGMGMNALFNKMMIAQAGLTPGGELIAGGMGQTEMDSGILASWGGCAGACIGKVDTYSRALARLFKANKFILAMVGK